MSGTVSMTSSPALRSRNPERAFGKTYAALVAGSWPDKLKVIDVALHKYVDAEGTRRVRTVDAAAAEGRRSITLVRVARRFADHFQEFRPVDVEGAGCRE